MSESSSCGTIETAPFGRQGIGVTQPQSGVDYPFVLPSENVRYLLADFWLSYDDPADYPPHTAEPFTLPFSVDWLYGFGCEDAAAPDDTPTPTHAADLRVIDADGRTVFDSTTADEFASRDWGDRLRIYSWETADAVCRVVVHTAWGETDTPAPRTYPVHLVPADGTLDERTTERRPKRVKSFKILLDQFDKTNVDWEAGYNMRLSHNGQLSTPGGRLSQQVIVAATPGLGLGVFPGCTPPPLLIRSIRGVRPTENGAFYLAADDCYYVRQPTTLTSTSPRLLTPTAAMLTIGNDCPACCSCDDYVSAAEYLNSVRDEYQQLGDTASDIRDLYHENRERWLSAADCVQRRPLSLVMQAQYCPTLDVVAQYCNQSDECVGPLEMRIDFGATSVAGSPIPGYAFITGANPEAGRLSGKTERYVMGGGWPVFTAYFDAVQPQSSVYVKFRLRFDDLCAGETPAPLVARATFTATIDGDAVTVTPVGGGPATPASVSVEEPLDCPPAFDRVDPADCCPESP